MPPKAVSSMGMGFQNFGKTTAELAEEREPLDPAVMAEMLYSGFEQGIEELSQRGISLPPPTDMNGHLMPGYEPSMTRVAHTGNAGGMQRGGPMPASSSEVAIVALTEVRDDMLRKYSSVSRDPVMAATMAMSIQKIEAQIISMGGEVERFDPAQHQSGLKPVGQDVDPMVVAKRVVANTQQTYTLCPIESIFAGKTKTGRVGVCVKIASSNGSIIHGTVVPKAMFSGNEVIDYVPDAGKGKMTVKMANRNCWEDVSSDFAVDWMVVKPT